MLISSDICADGLPGVAGESRSAQRDPFTHVSLELKCAQHAVAFRRGEDTGTFQSSVSTLDRDDCLP